MTGGLGVLPHTHVILATDASEPDSCSSLVGFVPPGPASDLTLATCGHCAVCPAGDIAVCGHWGSVRDLSLYGHRCSACDLAMWGHCVPLVMLLCAVTC